MASLRKILLAGVAAVGIAVSGAASAQNAHIMTVAVPGGGIAQIRYVGDVPPQAAFEARMSVTSVFGPDSPFAMMDRIVAEMDRRTAAMFRYAEAIADRASVGGLAETALGAVPPGGESYSYVSTMSGNGVCAQSIRIMSRGDGAPPFVERHSSGNCGAAAVTPGRSGVQPAAPVPMAPAKQPDLILTQGAGGPYAGMVRHVASVR
jgi:hypothetical protein